MAMAEMFKNLKMREAIEKQRQADEIARKNSEAESQRIKTLEKIARLEKALENATNEITKLKKDNEEKDELIATIKSLMDTVH